MTRNAQHTQFFSDALTEIQTELFKGTIAVDLKKVFASPEGAAVFKRLYEIQNARRPRGVSNIKYFHTALGGDEIKIPSLNDLMNRFIKNLSRVGIMVVFDFENNIVISFDKE